MTTAGQENMQAGIYCRLSLAKYGDTTKVEDQERICRELAGRLGWTVAEVYADKSQSAWQANRKRPQWERMLTDVDAGRINAIVVYHGDRLIRRHEDLSALLKLAKSKGIRLASPTGTRDLDNYDDQFVLEIEVSVAKRESANLSRRKKSEYERLRRTGRVRPGGRGGRAYGFTTDGVAHVPAETAIIREAADRVLAGEGILTIARDISARGARTPTGLEFGPTTLREMLARPRLAGLMPDGIHPAAWKPILDRETWEDVCAALKTRAAAFPYITNARKYLLTGIAVCGPCGVPVQVRHSGHRIHADDGRQCVSRSCEREHRWRASPAQVAYGCTEPGCLKVRRSVRLLDAYVTRRTVNRLNNPANPPGRIPAAPGLATQFSILAHQHAETEAAIEDPANGQRLQRLLTRLDVIETRLAELRDLAGEDARTRLIRRHERITDAEFAGLPLATQRALISACYRIEILPASKRGPGFRTEDVRLTPR